jgi:hypothetical protein
MVDDEWNNFIIEGDILYDHMINNFESLFNENKIKHFNIRDGIYWYIANTNRIYELYGDNIQIELVPWIKKELEENRLFDRKLWKPFRDSYSISDMYYGYRKLFQYKCYYFQLSLLTSCSLYECNICDLTDDKYCLENSKHFELALYGWKDDNSNMLQPIHKVEISTDNMMHEKHWLYQ